MVSPWSPGHGAGTIDNGGIGEVSQDVAAEDVGGGGGVNSRDGSDGGDRAGVGQVGGAFCVLC